MSDFEYAGSISSGTMLPSDLIPSFISVLEELDPASAKEIAKHYKYYDIHPFPKNWLPDTCASWRFDYDSDNASYMLEALFDKLGELAPEGYYFSAHPGDGADYGFWQDE